MVFGDMTKAIIEAQRTIEPVGVAEFEHAAWNEARPVHLTRYWSGRAAPAARHAEARVLWDDDGLCVRFMCQQAEPPVVNRSPTLERKTLGLWERDVCEFFVAPDAAAPENYFEFEAAPTGEWLDVAVNWRADGRDSNWEFQSGMRTAARPAGEIIAIAMRVPFAAFGRAPARAGARWRANLFRCVGTGRERGYLAWQPTHTAEPNFHVPQKFGWLIFNE